MVLNGERINYPAVCTLGVTAVASAPAKSPESITSCVSSRANAPLLITTILSSRSPSAVPHHTGVIHDVPILSTSDEAQHTPVAFRTRSIGFSRSRLPWQGTIAITRSPSTDVAARGAKRSLDTTASEEPQKGPAALRSRVVIAIGTGLRREARPPRKDLLAHWAPPLGITPSTCRVAPRPGLTAAGTPRSHHHRPSLHSARQSLSPPLQHRDEEPCSPPRRYRRFEASVPRWAAWTRPNRPALRAAMLTEWGVV